VAATQARNAEWPTIAPRPSGCRGTDRSHRRFGRNLGTTDSPSYFAVQRYLREFLSDRRVINTSRLIWLPLLYAVILPFRPMRTLRKYARSGCRRLALAVYSGRLTVKIRALLRARFGDRLCVELGMTYGNPSVAQAMHPWPGKISAACWCCLCIRSIARRPRLRIRSGNHVLRRWRWLPRRASSTITITMRAISKRWLRGFSNIGKKWRTFSSAVLLSRGSRGIRGARRPYQRQAEATTAGGVPARPRGRGVVALLPVPLRFSGVAPAYAEDTLKALVERGVRTVTVASPSFAVDCLETLEEVAMEYRDKFVAMGGERLTLVPALNDDDRHAEVLADILNNHLRDWAVAGPD